MFFYMVPKIKISLPIRSHMSNENEILERLRRIEAKLDQCIAMGNENRMTCDKIMQEIMSIREGPGICEEAKNTIKEENDSESKKVKMIRIREEKELIMMKTSKLTAEKENLKKRYFKSDDSEKTNVAKEIESVDKEIETLREELQKIIERQQSLI
jgi:hypothetical protein